MSPHPPRRSGPGRIIAGIAIVAVIGLAGAGLWMYRSKSAVSQQSIGDRGDSAVAYDRRHAKHVAHHEYNLAIHAGVRTGDATAEQRRAGRLPAQRRDAPGPTPHRPTLPALPTPRPPTPQ